jgi:hypothetical protein
VRVPLGYVDATSLQWVFTWRKCGGGYESVETPTTKTEVVESSKTEEVVVSSATGTGTGTSGAGWTTTATETKWITVTETTTAGVPVVGLPTAKLP